MFDDPCKDATLRQIKEPFEDQEVIFFAGDSLISYNPNLQFGHSIPGFSCGDFAMSFTDVEDEALDSDLFDDGSWARNPAKTFKIFSPTSGDMIGASITIKYRVTLVSYPEKEIFGSFKVKYILEDVCDQRLVIDNILAQLNPNCGPVDTSEIEFDPATLTPLWLKKVRDELILVLGGEDLKYEFDEPLNYKDEALDVTVDFGAL